MSITKDGLEHNQGIAIIGWKMTIEEIRANAPSEMANYYRYNGGKIEYFSVRTRHVYKWICKDKWSGDWGWEKLIDHNNTDRLKPL